MRIDQINLLLFFKEVLTINRQSPIFSSWQLLTMGSVATIKTGGPEVFYLKLLKVCKSPIFTYRPALNPLKCLSCHV